jgi:hypothetical protein
LSNPPTDHDEKRLLYEGHCGAIGAAERMLLLARIGFALMLMLTGTW